MSNNQREESITSRNVDDREGEMGIAYTTDEVDYLDHFSNNNQNPVEYLEFLATQEPYSPKNLSLNQDSFHQPSNFQQQEQFIGLRGGPALSNVHYVMSPDDPRQFLPDNNINNNHNISNSNVKSNYNPYFPPTQQINMYNNPLSLSPLDEVVQHNAAPYPDQSEPYQIEVVDVDDDTSSPLCSQEEHDNQQINQNQFQNQIPQLSNPSNNDNNNNNEKVDEASSPIDHSTVTPSPLSLPSLLLSRNRSRISTPKVEVSLNLPSAYTAQVQQSDSPLRSEFRKSDLNNNNHDINVHKVRLSEILNEKRLSDQKLVSIMKNNSPHNPQNESIVKFDFHNATGDPDDPLLNNDNISGSIQLQEEEQRRLPTGLLNGNSIENNNMINTSNNIPNASYQHSNVPQPISSMSPTYPIPPTSHITQKPLIANKNDEGQNHDAVETTTNIETIEKFYKPKQGTIFMLINIFTIAAIVFVTWRLGAWGIGQAKGIYGTLRVLGL